MANGKITISLTEKQLKDIEALIANGEAENASDFVQNAVTNAIDSTKSLDELLDDMLERTGGPPTAEEIAWVEQAMGGGEPPVRKTSRKKKAA